MTELADRIRTRSSLDHNELEDLDEFVNFFPDFVWTLRDFSLELKVNGKPISADEYLENSLRLIQGKRPKLLNEDVIKSPENSYFSIYNFLISKIYISSK